MKSSLRHRIAAFLFCGSVVCGWLLAAQADFASAADSVSLRSAKPDGAPVRVTANLEVGGTLKTAIDKTAGKQPDPVPMSVVAKFGYDEQRLDDGGDDAHRLSIRSYDESQAVIKIASRVTKPQLRDSRKLVSAASTKSDVVLSSPAGPLTRDELELIDIPANTLVLDQILPQGEVQPGHRWKPSEDVMARFLCLDAVGHTEVECVLVDVKDDVATITLDGTLGGAIDGIATDIELKGKLLVDTSHAEKPLPKSLLLAIKEQRGASYVDPGVDVVAKLKLTIAPLTESNLLTSEIIEQAKLPQTDSDAISAPLEYFSDSKGFRFQYDRRWHITREEPALLVMRLVNRGELVAQCNVAPTSLPLPSGEGRGEGAESAAAGLALSDFQTQVQDALGKLFGQFEKAKQSATESGLRVLEAVADGTAQELPIQWRYYMVHDKQGRALTVVFTMEAPQAQQFADQDTPIVESVQFMEAKTARSDSDKAPDTK